MEGLTRRPGADCLHYLYGFLRSAAALPAIDGVEAGTRVFAVAYGDLACAASLVPAEDYDPGDGPPAHDWLAPRAIRHHQVLSTLHGVTTVLPLRFGALCGTEDDVRALVADRRDVLLNVLASLDGRDEWTLRMSADAAAIDARSERESPALAALGDRASEASAGCAYFLRKQRERAAAALAVEARTAIEDAVFGALAPLGCAAVRGRRGADGFVESSLLVERDRREAVHGVLADLEDRQAWCGLRFALVGPWPPYSFAPAIGPAPGN